MLLYAIISVTAIRGARLDEEDATTVGADTVRHAGTQIVTALCNTKFRLLQGKRSRQVFKKSEGPRRKSFMLFPGSGWAVFNDAQFNEETVSALCTSFQQDAENVDTNSAGSADFAITGDKEFFIKGVANNECNFFLTYAMDGSPVPAALNVPVLLLAAGDKPCKEGKIWAIFKYAAPSDPDWFPVEYDLKGSLLGRVSESGTRKDNNFLHDFEHGIHLDVTTHSLLAQQIGEAMLWCVKHRAVDYSMLIYTGAEYYKHRASDRFPRVITTYHNGTATGLVMLGGIIDNLETFEDKNDVGNSAVRTFYNSTEFSIVPPFQYACRFYSFLMNVVFRVEDSTTTSTKLAQQSAAECRSLMAEFDASRDDLEKLVPRALQAMGSISI